MNKRTFPITSGYADPIVGKNTKVFRSIIGQPEACKKLAFFVDSHSLETPFPTMLFSGSQGLGKSYMAQKVADALGRKLVEVNCGSIETAKEFFEDVVIKKLVSDFPKTVLFDEAQKLSPEITTILLTMLNPNKELKNEVEFIQSNGSLMFLYEFSKINFIFATTDAYKMVRPLVNRCTEIYFHLYSNEDLIKILNYYLPDVTFKCDQEDIAYACRGRARDTFLLSQNVMRYCKINNTNVIDAKAWTNIKNIFSIHAKGLTKIGRAHV